MAAPQTPLLVSPDNNAYLDANSGLTLSWTHRGYGGEAQAGVAIRRRVAGAVSYEWWDGAAWQATEQWIAQATESYTFAAGLWPNNTTYQWSVATRNSALEASAYASERVLVASAPPVADVVAPLDPVESSRPAVEWTYADAEGHAYTAYRVALFTEAQYTAGGFDPDTSESVWDTGKTSTSSVLSVPVGIDVEQGTTYRAYVRVWQTGDQPSAWDFIEFSVNLTKPNAPSLIATSEPDDARIHLQVVGTVNLLSVLDSNFEGIGNWVAEDDCTVQLTSDWAAQGTQSLKVTITLETYASWVVGAGFATYADAAAAYATYGDAETDVF